MCLGVGVVFVVVVVVVAAAAAQLLLGGCDNCTYVVMFPVSFP